MADYSLFAYPDQALTATFSGGSWLATADIALANLTDPDLSSVARSIGATLAATKYNIDLGQERSIRLLSILGHNASPAALVRHRFYSDAGHIVLTYDTGWQPFYPFYWPAGVLEWEEPSFWDGALSAEDAATFKPDYWQALAQPIAARYGLVEIDDTTNPDGYFEHSRSLVMPARQLPIKYGVSTMYSSDTVVTRSLGSVDFFDVREGRRTITGQHDYLTLAEGMAHIFDRQRRLDIHGELFFVFNPDDTLLLYKQRSMLCRSKQPDPLEYPYFDATSNAFQLEEIL